MRQHILLFLVQTIGYAVVAFLVWMWLGISDSSVLALAGSSMLIVLIAGGLVLLLATAFAASLYDLSHWRGALLLLFLGAVLIAAGVWLNSYGPRVTNYLAAMGAKASNRVVRPQSIAWIYPGVIAALSLAIFFALLPRLIMGLSRAAKLWQYWVLCPIALLIGVYIPWRLIWWVPKASTLAMQTTSMALRFKLAYLLAVGTLLLFAAGVRRMSYGFVGKPDLIQPSTVERP